jgi:hypothetical protein
MREETTEELRLKCNRLLMKTYTALGQTPLDDTVLTFSLMLADDLAGRYRKLSWQAIELAFHNGVRETDKFHINAQVWCKWLNTMRDLIWSGQAHLEKGSHHAVNKEIRHLIENKIKLLK